MITHQSFLGLRTVIRFCPICGTQCINYKSIPQNYMDQLLNYEYIHSLEEAETINCIEYNCHACLSTDRDRLYAHYIMEQFKYLDVSQKYTFIDFAPNRALSQHIRNYPFLNYRTADLKMSGVDDIVDITNLNIYQDNSTDFFLCSHVLEHVPDDRKAMSELYRILKPDGWGILMVPILLSLAHNYEILSNISESERWKLFGEVDHLRIYAKGDYIKALEETGFIVNQLGIEYFGTRVFKELGLSPTSVLYVVQKQIYSKFDKWAAL
ncbi:MAG: methyltransferase domain-containing protein [Cyanobacteria bacterium]|nr:methyltransferase domain-containing protein [Cyanobacteriota bacterium]